MALPPRIPKSPKRSSRWRSQALSAHALRGLLRYNDGKLYWLARPRGMFADERSFKTWNARFSDKEAFTAIHSDGYRVGRIFGTAQFAHRVIWVLHFGQADGLEIDHINGDRSDNKITNLRAVTRPENMRNTKRPKTNKSGVIGVYSRGKRWMASIQCDKILHNLGTFDTFDDAVAARKAAEQRLGFHNQHGRL